MLFDLVDRKDGMKSGTNAWRPFAQRQLRRSGDIEIEIIWSDRDCE